MPDNYIKRHLAVCNKCSHIEENHSSGSFITDFFLPSMCRNCGEHPKWIHRVITSERVPAKRSIWKPWTWIYFDGWKEVNRTDMKVY